MTYRLKGPVYISFLAVMAAYVLPRQKHPEPRLRGHKMKERAQKAIWNGVQNESTGRLGSGKSKTHAGFSTDDSLDDVGKWQF